MNKHIQITILILCLLIPLTGCAHSIKPFFQPTKEERLQYLKLATIEDPEIVSAIKKGKIVNGMSRKEVEASWGEPYKDFGDQWEYRGWSNITIHFEDNKVVKVRKNLQL